MVNKLMFLTVGLFLILLPFAFALTQEEITAMYNSLVLLAYMDVDGTVDSSPNADTGVVTGATWTNVGCVIDGCMVFDGGNDNNIEWEADKYDAMTNVTAICWATNPTAETAQIIGRRQVSANGEWELYTSAASGVRGFYRATATEIIASAALKAEWNMYTYRANGTNDRHYIYLNDTLKDNNDLGTAGIVTNSIMMGESQGSITNGWGEEFTGKLDECAVFNKSLTEAEIKYYYDETKAGRHFVATPPVADPAIISFMVNASDAYNKSAIDTFKVYINNATHSYGFQSKDGWVNISNATVEALNNSVFDLSVYSENNGGYYNITYVDVNITAGTEFYSNLTKYINLFRVTYANYTEGVDGYNYTRNLSFTLNMTCVDLNKTDLNIFINGNRTINYTLNCNNATMFVNGSYKHNAEHNYSIAFLINSTLLSDNNTYPSKNITFISDLYSPTIDYLNFTVTAYFGQPLTNVTLRCKDSVAANLTYNLTFNGVELRNVTLANFSNVTNQTALQDGYNIVEGICKDYISSASSSLNYTIYVRSIILIDEKDNDIFNVDNATQARAYFDDNSTYFDFKTKDTNLTNFTIMGTNNLRFEFVYSNAVVTRYIDLSLTDPVLRVCANKEGVTHYEQLIRSATERPVVLKNVFSNCLVAADYTRFVYQDSLLLKAFTIEGLYYLYTYDEGHQVYLASLDGSIATYIDIDQLLFSATAYDLDITGEDISFYNYNNNSIKIYYLNKQADNTALDLTITNMLVDTTVLHITDFDDYNEFTIFFNYATLSNITNETIFKLDLLKTTEAGESTLTRYFNLAAKSGILNSSLALVLGFLFSIFGLTLAATRITLSWFGVLIMIGSIALLSTAIETWYIIFLIALDAIVLIYIVLMATIKNYSTIT